MDYKMIRLEQTEGIAVITLDYAPTLNALDMNMSLELEDALKKAETDPDVKIVVITGAGRAFCGGGDIRYMKAHCEEPDGKAKDTVKVPPGFSKEQISLSSSGKKIARKM